MSWLVDKRVSPRLSWELERRLEVVSRQSSAGTSCVYFFPIIAIDSANLDGTTVQHLTLVSCSGPHHRNNNYDFAIIIPGAPLLYLYMLA